MVEVKPQSTPTRLLLLTFTMFPTTFEMLEGLARRVRAGRLSESPHVLYYDMKAGELRPWFWCVFKDSEEHMHCYWRRSRPLDENEIRVAENELLTHKVFYDFRFPPCFCSLMKGQPTTFYESELLIEFRNEYFLGCGTNTCNYKGSLVHIVCASKTANWFGHTLVKTHFIHENVLTFARYYPRRTLPGIPAATMSARK
jgi:hypothetical protein